MGMLVQTRVNIKIGSANRVYITATITCHSNGWRSRVVACTQAALLRCNATRYSRMSHTESTEQLIFHLIFFFFFLIKRSKKTFIRRAHRRRYAKMTSPRANSGCEATSSSVFETNTDKLIITIQSAVLQKYFTLSNNFYFFIIHRVFFKRDVQKTETYTLTFSRMFKQFSYVYLLIFAIWNNIDNVTSNNGNNDTMLV